MCVTELHCCTEVIGILYFSHVHMRVHTHTHTHTHTRKPVLFSSILGRNCLEQYSGPKVKG